MSPHAATNGATQSQRQNRKKSSLNRVAIPLPLSRPKPARPQPKPEPESTAGAETAEQPDISEALDDATVKDVETTQLQEQDEPVSNLTETNPSSEAVEDKVRLPDVSTPISRGSAPMSLSNGQTPEPEVLHSSRPCTPPKVAASPTPEVSPASSRKPASIRTELPPDFVPSASLQTPQSATSSSYFGRNSQPHYPHGHPSRPSTSSIVFGGLDSSTSSPAPPQSAGSSYMPPQYPSQNVSQNQFQGHSSHNHHSSEPQVHYTALPSGQAHSVPWHAPRQFYAPQQQPLYAQPYGQRQFQYPPRQTFTPTEAPHVNGYAQASRSDSQTSSTASQVLKGGRGVNSPSAADQSSDVPEFIPEPKSTFTSMHPAMRHPPMGRQMPPPLPALGPDLRAELDNAQAMRDYVRAAFASPALSDCQLLIVAEDDDSRLSVDGHKLILARSPRLFDIIEASEPTTSDAPKTQLHVRIKGKYMALTPFMEGLRYLYGEPLPQPQHRSAQTQEDSTSNEQRIQYALRHIAAGAWLRVPAVAMRGVEIASNLLHWDTLVPALEFALEGGLNPSWTVDDGSEDRISTSSSDDSLSRPEMLSLPTFDPYATHLLHNVMAFVVNVFPRNFYSDTAAPQLVASPRLPSAPPNHESRPSRSDPRLSKIRFGELSIEETTRPSPVTTTISSILFSLPYPLLKYLLEHPILTNRLGVETVASIMRQVIMERETRRVKALKARTAAQSNEAVDSQQVQNLYWEEIVEPFNQYPVGLRLARRRRGIDTPPSSGAGSERTG